MKNYLENDCQQISRPKKINNFLGNLPQAIKPQAMKKITFKSRVTCIELKINKNI